MLKPTAITLCNIEFNVHIITGSGYNTIEHPIVHAAGILLPRLSMFKIFSAFLIEVEECLSMLFVHFDVNI